MNTSKIASLAIAAAIGAAASATASAGELYRGLDNSLTAGSAPAMTAGFNTGPAASGVLYGEIDTALTAAPDNMAVAMTPQTRLVVGGELGYPYDSTRRLIGNTWQPTAAAE